MPICERALFCHVASHFFILWVTKRHIPIRCHPRHDNILHLRSAHCSRSIWRAIWHDSRFLLRPQSTSNVQTQAHHIQSKEAGTALSNT